MNLGLQFIFTITACLSGLQNVFAQSDSTIFTYDEYILNVKKYHPIAIQADLKPEYGEAELLKAKGNIDPTISSVWNEKNFKDQLYYQKFASKLRIPTPLGLDVVGGYENAKGVYLNPENTTDPNGLWHLGVELDILRGLIVNERSAILKQARVFQDLAKNEQQIILNELIYNATYAYLNWQLSFHFNKVLIENQELAKNYFNITKQTFLAGEKTAMDTLEAHILFQDATLEFQKNEMQLIQSRLIVENFLWYNYQPIALQQNTQPENFQNQFLTQPSIWTDTSWVDNNPAIGITLNKLSMLEIEQKLKRDKLKPKLKLKYNPLLSTSPNSLAPNYDVDNYVLGFDFTMPLFLRNERASIHQGNIKIQEVELELINKKNELHNKIENSRQQQVRLQELQTLLQQNVENYQRLLEGENEKFRFGESSVFLLNKRQEKYITARLKLIDTTIKQQIELLKYLYFTNQLVKD